MRFLPWRVCYGIGNGVIYPLLRYVLRYRKDTIETQLRACLDYGDKDLSTTRDGYYKHLSKIILEIMKGLQTDQKSLAEHMIYTNPEVLVKHLSKNQDIIMMAGHYQNWEWAIGVAQNYLQHQVVGVYKPMSNSYVNDYILRRRQKNGAKLISTSAFIKEVLTDTKQPRVFMIMTDQYPSGSTSERLYTFLGRQTKFQCGVDKVVEKYKLPTYYTDIQQISKGKYHLGLIEMTSDGQYSEITSRYVKQLERSIKAEPTAWLWSHRRWRD